MPSDQSARLQGWIRALVLVGSLNAAVVGVAQILIAHHPILHTVVWWLVARASGATALAGLTALVALGWVMSHPRWKAQTIKRLLPWHRTVAGVVLTFVVAHVTAIALDPFVPIGWVGVVVPGWAAYRPAGVALGLFSAYWMAILAVTAYWARPLWNRIRWTTLHRGAAAAWIAGWFHAVLTGSDTAWWAGAYAALGLGGLALGLTRYWAERPVAIRSGRQPR